MALIELRTQLLTDNAPSDNKINYPVQLGDSSVNGFQAELFSISSSMQQAYIDYGSGSPRQVTFRDGAVYDLTTSPNAGTFALQTGLAKLSQNTDEFLRLASQEAGSFVAMYQQLFDDPRTPTAQTNTSTATLSVSPFLYKPFVGSFAAGSFFDHDGRSGLKMRFDGVKSMSYDNHAGTDYPMAPGQKLLAAADGVVVDVAKNRSETIAGWCKSQGYAYTPVTGMLIKHTIGGVEHSTMYWHLSSGAIATNPRTGGQFKPGDTIYRGELLGYSGNTGCSSGAHLHFEVKRAGAATDPYGWCGSGSDLWPVKNYMLWAGTMSNPSPCPAPTPTPTPTPTPSPTPTPTPTHNDYNGDGKGDLYTISKQGVTGSGKTEVHILNGADHFQSFLLRTATTLHTTGTDGAWVFDIADYNKDGKLDLYAISKQGVAGSGRTEVHILNGADHFQSFLLHNATTLHTTGNDCSWDFATGQCVGQ